MAKGVLNSDGCFFVGTMLATWLYGCSLAQTMYYMKTYSKDRIYLKILVATLFLLDTIRTAAYIQMTWVWLIIGHANPVVVLVLPRSIAAVEISSVTSILELLLVQSFFISNIWRLLKSTRWRIPLSLIAATLSITSAGGNAAVLYFETSHKTFSNIEAYEQVAGIVEVVSTFATDLYINVSLLIILYQQRTGLRRTERMLAKLSTYTMQRGTLLVIVQLLSFINLGKNNSMPLIADTIHVMAPLLYTNTLLAVLNVRHHIVDSVADAFTPMSDPVSISSL